MVSVFAFHGWSRQINSPRERNSRKYFSLSSVMDCSWLKLELVRLSLVKASAFRDRSIGTESLKLQATLCLLSLGCMFFYTLHCDFTTGSKRECLPWRKRTKLSCSKKTGRREGWEEPVLHTRSRLEVFALIVCICRSPVWKKSETISWRQASCSDNSMAQKRKPKSESTRHPTSFKSWDAVELVALLSGSFFVQVKILTVVK